MFRALLFLYGAVVVGLVALSYVKRDARYLVWARRLFLTGLGVGVAMATVVILKRMI